VALTLGTGLCGALTTYSTFGYETFRLFEDGARLYALLNVGVSMVAGLGSAIIGYALGATL
jgi:CrcB protein